MPYWCTKFEGNQSTRRLLKVKLLSRCNEEANMKKIDQFSEIHIPKTTESISFKFLLVCKVIYMEEIKYVNLIEIGPVVIEIRGIENGYLVVPVNTVAHLCGMTFLAADIQPCVLMQ